MQTYKTIVSPPFSTGQSFRRPGHEDRDEIKRRAEADFPQLYVEHGGRRRGKMWHCIFHDDGRPSASIRNGRFHCFACGINLDVIDFVIRVQRTDFKGALAYLGDRYGVPLRSWRLPPAHRPRYVQEQRDLERDLPDALRWKSTASAMAEVLLARLKAPLADPAAGTAEPDEIFCFEKFLLRLRRLEGAALVDEYRRWAKDSQLTPGMMYAAELREAAAWLAAEDYWAKAEDRWNGRA